MKAKFWSIEENKKLKELLLDEKAYTMLQISDIMKKSLGSVDNRKQRLFQSFTKDEKQRHMLLRTKARNTMIAKKSLYWNSELVNKLKVACESGLYNNLSEIQKEIFSNSSVSQLRNVLSNNGLRMYSRKVEYHRGFKTESIDNIPVKNSSEEYWKLMEETSNEEIVLFKQESYHNIVFNDKKYIGFTCIGDQHFGKIGIDYKQAREDAQIIKNTDNMYVLFGGDFFENYIKANIMEALVNKDSSPKREQMLLEHYFKFFGNTDEEITNKIVASISGNHDWRTSDVSGIDLIKTMIKGKRMLYSPEELRLTIKLNGIDYKIAARHQYRFNSALNYTHTVKRWYDEGEEPFDVGVIWHNHRPDIEEFVKHNKMRWGIRPGSYKIKCRWSKSKGYPITLPLMPTFILNPFERSIVVFKHVQEASDYLRLKNAELKKK
jgi:hypothetical protein